MAVSAFRHPITQKACEEDAETEEVSSRIPIGCQLNPRIEIHWPILHVQPTDTVLLCV